MALKRRQKIQLNNPHRKTIHTPFGVFIRAEDFAKKHGNVTSNGVGKLVKNSDKIISRSSAVRNLLLNEEHIVKTYRGLSYYEL